MARGSMWSASAASSLTSFPLCCSSEWNDKKRSSRAADYFLSFWNLLGAGTYIGIIVIVICHATGAQSELLQVATGVLNITLWINMFQYLQMTETFAVLVVMMSHMVRDVAKFILLYTVFLFGSSGGFYVLFFRSQGYTTFIDALITVLVMLFGQISCDPFNTATGLTWVVANLLLLACLVSVVIVLLNLLIAMMSTSYSNVWVEAESQVLLSYAQTIVRMGQSLTQAAREKQVKRLMADAEAVKKRRWRESYQASRSKDVAGNLKQYTRVLYWDAIVLGCDRIGMRSYWDAIEATYSRRKRMEAAWTCLMQTLDLLVVSVVSAFSPSSHKSVSLLAWDSITGCSTLENGERWEIVEKQTDSSDQQAALNTRVEKLTSPVNTLVKEPSTDTGQQFPALHSREGKLTMHVDQLTMRVDHLTTRVDHFTTLVEQQTALIKEHSDSMRVLAGQLRAGAEAKV